MSGSNGLYIWELLEYAVVWMNLFIVVTIVFTALKIMLCLKICKAPAPGMFLYMAMIYTRR